MSGRITRELAQIKGAESEIYTVEPVNDDLFHWKGEIRGPNETPYEGGIFKIDIVFPPDYPLRSPQIKFDTKIYHPDVITEGERAGKFCLEILSDWHPKTRIKDILESIYSFIHFPVSEGAVNAEIAREMREDIQLFNEKAAKWTKDYAMN